MADTWASGWAQTWAEAARFDPYHGKPGSGHGGQFVSSGDSGGGSKPKAAASPAAHGTTGGGGGPAGHRGERKRELEARISADRARIRKLGQELHSQEEALKTAASKAAHAKAQASAAHKLGRTTKAAAHHRAHKTHHRHAQSHRQRITEIRGQLRELRTQVKSLEGQVAKL